MYTVLAAQGLMINSFVIVKQENQLSRHKFTYPITMITKKNPPTCIICHRVLDGGVVPV